MRRCLVIYLLLFGGVCDADARGGRNPETVPSGVARDIVDGDTLVLSNGTEVRLVGIQAPKLPLGRPNFRKWPLADEAKTALASLALGKRLELRYGDGPIDRHGRLLADLFGPDGQWIQGELLARGMARTYTFRDNRTRARELLAIEDEARRGRKGIWAHPFYRVVSAAESAQFIDTFQLVEGLVLDTAVVRGRAYLNFGRDWRSDFTISVARRDVRLFRRAGTPPSSYDGRRVRVRGWLKSRNGPMIVVTHPEQIELLDK